MLQFGWEGFSRKGEINNVAEKEKKGSKNSFFFYKKVSGVVGLRWEQ